MDGCTYEWMTGWMNGRIDRCMDGYIHDDWNPKESQILIVQSTQFFVLICDTHCDSNQALVVSIGAKFDNDI